MKGKETIGQILCHAFDAPEKTVSVTIEAHCAKFVRVTFLYYRAPLKVAANRRRPITLTTTRLVAPKSQRVIERLREALR